MFNMIKTMMIIVYVTVLFLLFVAVVVNATTSYLWTSLSNGISTDSYWVGATISSSGQYMAAAAGYVAGPNLLGGIYLSSDSGTTWSQSSAGTTLFWTSICSDSTGQYLIAGADESGVWVSTDTGSIWQLSYSTTSNVQDVACTSSGQNVYAMISTGAVLASTQQGFAMSTIFTSTAGTAYGIAADSTGDTLLASYSNGYYLSIDGGSTWNQVYSTSSASYLYHLAISSNGLYQMGNLEVSSGSGGVLVSTNNGSSFTLTYDQIDMYAVAMSSSGELMLATASTSLYSSTSYGASNTWSTLTTSSSTLQSVACNSNGDYILMGEERGSLYLGVAQNPTSSPAIPPTPSPTIAPSYPPTATPSYAPTASPTAPLPVTFSYTGNVQTYTVTTSSIQVEACGASGGTFSGTGGTGGNGGCITATISVTIGTTLYVYVGGAGAAGSNSVSSAAGGYNGGANGVYGSGGGGASDVRNSEYDLTSRIIVGSGGGGGGGNSGTGGSGGGTSGSNGVASYGSAATGGTQSTGGTGGYCAGYKEGGQCPSTDQGGDGSYGYGGAAGSGGGDNGGGGAGYYGGGGGAGDGGGAGGSSYYTGTLISDIAATNSGNGYVTITAIEEVPSLAPTTSPTVTPTTSVPTLFPSQLPTESPTVAPSVAPTVAPTLAPTAQPSMGPTTPPTTAPTWNPTTAPSEQPSMAPTAPPSIAPTEPPTIAPTRDPFALPTIFPTQLPSIAPTGPPTLAPIAIPTAMPSDGPTLAPTASPSIAPTAPLTIAPTRDPFALPTIFPTQLPSIAPTGPPTLAPTASPTAMPSDGSTCAPTASPTASPSITATTIPTALPTTAPTTAQTTAPNAAPTVLPTTITPTPLPSIAPTVAFAAPTLLPSLVPTLLPSALPTFVTNSTPTFGPSELPTLVPLTSTSPTMNPATSIPTQQPFLTPTFSPTMESSLTFSPTDTSNTTSNSIHHSPFKCLIAHYCDSTDSDLLGLSFTLGILVFVFTSLVLCWRKHYDPNANKLNESKSFTAELLDSMFRAFNVTCAMFALFTANHVISQAGLIISRLLVFGISFVLMLRLIWSPMVFTLLNKESLKQFMGVTVYGFMIVISSMDVMVWKLLPWRATVFSSITSGYPDILLMRTMLYGNFVSIMLQTISGYIGFFLDPSKNKFYTNYPDLYILYLLVSSLNLLRSFISVMFFILLASTNDLEVAVIQQKEFDSILSERDRNASRGNGVEFQERHSMMSSSLMRAEDDTMISSLTQSQVLPPTDIESNVSSTIVTNSSISTPTDPEPYTQTVNPLHSETQAKNKKPPKEKKLEMDIVEEEDENEETEEERKKRLYATTIPFAEKNVDILKKQLTDMNVMPLQYIPLSVLKEEVDQMVQQINRGETFDERRLDYLLRCMDVNPEYLEEKNQKLERWRQKAEIFTSESLDFIRGFIPPMIFTYSEKQFKEEAIGWPAGLIKRIWQKRVLWLTRLSRVDIERLHEADLYNKYNYQGQALDLTEIAAIYAAVPPKFWNDPTGRKNTWRATLEKSLQDMMEQDEQGKLPSSKKKNTLYKPSYALYNERTSLYAFDAVSGKDALNPRTSFKGISKAEIEEIKSVIATETNKPISKGEDNNTASSGIPAHSVKTEEDATVTMPIKPKLPPPPRRSVNVDSNMKASLAQALQQKMQTRRPPAKDSSPADDAL